MQLPLRLGARKFLWPVAISVAVATFTAFAAVFVSYLLFPVKGIEVQSARMFPESEAWETLPKYASLLSLSTETLERRIESNPWVKGAKVIKDWESGIVTVEVEERRAALYGELGNRRIVLAADGTELPGLGGENLKRVGLDEAELEGILRILEVLDENGIRLESVDGIGAGGVETTVEGQRVLFSGELGEGQAWTLKGLMEEYPEALYFDLRSPSRVVVGAKSDDQSGSSGG